MSTHAVITVSNAENTFRIFRHHDGYPHGPHGVVTGLKKALADLAWPSPRFEADEAGAAIVASMKTKPGGIRLTHDTEHGQAFDYSLTGGPSGPMLVIHHAYSDREIYSGPLAMCHITEAQVMKALER
jgi:hypothetical protein